MEFSNRQKEKSGTDFKSGLKIENPVKNFSLLNFPFSRRIIQIPETENFVFWTFGFLHRIFPRLTTWNFTFLFYPSGLTFENSSLLPEFKEKSEETRKYWKTRISWNYFPNFEKNWIHLRIEKNSERKSRCLTSHIANGWWKKWNWKYDLKNKIG